MCTEPSLTVQELEPIQSFVKKGMVLSFLYNKKTLPNTYIILKF